MPDGDIKKPPKRKGYGERRALIMDAAIREFATHGFDGATMRQIGKLAGVNHQLIVHHFENMEGLWRAVMESLVADVDGLFAEALSKVDRDDTKAVLTTIIDHYVSFAAKRPEMHRMMMSEAVAKSDRFEWLVVTHVRRIHDMFVSYVRRGQEKGVVAAGDPLMMYYAVIGTANSGFTLAYEAKLLTGRDMFSEDAVNEVRQQCHRILGLI